VAKASKGILVNIVTEPTTTAVACVPTAVQKQQVLAAFSVSGTIERAKPLIANLWGVEQGELPDDIVLREWIGDVNVIPTQEQFQVAERFCLAANRAKLLTFRDEIIDEARGSLSRQKFFTLMGGVKILGDQLNATERKANTFNAGGDIIFSTSEDHGEIVEGQLADGGGSDTDSESD
jgi:hypothetical protein